MEAAPDRKLTTILSADVAGYSRLMERDEAGTLARLRSYREAFAEKIAGHRGRLVSATGDALLAEFGSVVNAVDCAVRVQRTLFERNAALPEVERMAFRIGINLGDVMVEGDGLFGEGVNIAARLEALAEPGGILISGTVFEQVRNKLSLGFDYIGPQPVKNISESVPAYRILLGEADLRADANARSGGTAAAAFPRPSSTLGKFVAAADSAATGAPPQKPRRTPRERLKRRATFAATLIAFLFAINILSWSGTLWVQWPALGILFLFALRTSWTGWGDEA